jgi:hypothetical protein
MASRDRQAAFGSTAERAQRRQGVAAMLAQGPASGSCSLRVPLLLHVNQVHSVLGALQQQLQMPGGCVRQHPWATTTMRMLNKNRRLTFSCTAPHRTAQHSAAHHITCTAPQHAPPTLQA